MKISEGVEWAAHVCVLLSALPEGAEPSAAALAAFHELPPAYMAKHLQALAKAGVARSSRGPRGGYRLARSPAEISLWDVYCAIEGVAPGFRCQEIRRRGPCAFSGSPKGPPCDIAAAFWGAERAFRERLEAVTIAQIALKVAVGFDERARRTFFEWLETVR